MFRSLFGGMGGAGIDNLSPKEFHEKYSADSNGVLVDVRTVDEFRMGHIKGAKNIDFYDPSFYDSMQKFDKSKTLYLYCRSGARSFNACAKLKSLGFENVVNMDGGIIQWRGPVER